jgi:very-short-patch-repair endonuclease
MQIKETPAMFYGAKKGTFEKAQELRNNMTEAEKALWMRLKSSQLGVRFKAQHPIDIFIADFYCHSYKLVVEVDGGIHNEQKDYDEGRTAELERFGIKVIRFSNKEILTDIENIINNIKICITNP